jgi:orotate phosphoribosyltransferase
MNTETRIAKHLLDVQAVSLQPHQPFTWASGLKSPIYCDNRITLSYPEVRSAITDAFVEQLQRTHPDVQVIAGVATAGIPQAALIAERMQLPMIYVRAQAKDHGKGNQIEGRAQAGQKVVLIEDLISTGGSSLIAVDALREAGLIVLSVSAIFSYRLSSAQERFAAHRCELYALSNYDALLALALELGQIQADDLAVLSAWKKDPKAWSNAHEK